MRLIKLWDERDLLKKLKIDTVSLIHVAPTIQPIKKLVEAADILDLTEQINERFPQVPPDPPMCDQGALKRLSHLSSELYLYHRLELPEQSLLVYGDKVRTLLLIYGVQL